MMRYICLEEVESTNSYAKSACRFLRDDEPKGIDDLSWDEYLDFDTINAYIDKLLFDESTDPDQAGGGIDNVLNDDIIVIRAKRQISGRGRNGNAFFSDHEGGLWVSIITRIPDISTHFEHNRAISLSIRKVLCGCRMTSGAVDNDAAVSIKWPNDVYWGDKKIAGILLENAPQDPNALIIGFGLNVNIVTDDFPDELQEVATSVLIETGEEHNIDTILEDILREYQRIIKQSPQEEAHREYVGNLYKKGHRAVIDQYSGIFVGVGIDGRLRLETDGADAVLISSGTLVFDDNGC